MSLRIGEVARRTRISVRTLHHYEQIGLLRASGRTPAGHRVYTQGDVERLQQIVCLKDLGLSLAEVRLCLDVDRASLQQVLESHCRAVEQRIALQQRTRQRLASLLARLSVGPALEMHDLLKSIEEMKVMQEQDWTAELMDKLRRHAESIGLEKFQAAKAGNQHIMRQVAECYREGVPPSDPRVQALLVRSQEVRHVITGGDPQLAAQLRRYNDEGFARTGPEGHFTDPVLIAYLESALTSFQP